MFSRGKNKMLSLHLISNGKDQDHSIYLHQE